MGDMGHDGTGGGHDISSMSDDSMTEMDHGAGGMPQHPASESGNPLVDMQTMSPAPKLDDPGIGLRDNGRKVLTYAALEEHLCRPGWARARAHGRAAPHRPHGKVRLVVRRHQVLRR
jgi:hypothetical protein